MPYRHEEIECRRAALAAELADVRAEPRTDARHEKERSLRSRLDALAIPEPRRPLPSLPLLPRLRIASPCTERWDAMVGSDRARHCSKCDKDVFDLSAMTTSEAIALLRAHEALPEGGLPCVRFYRRKDGTILTADCLEGAPRRISALAAAGAAVASAVGLAASLVPSAQPELPPRANVEPDRVVYLPTDTGDLMPLADIEELVFGGLDDYEPIDERVAHTLLPEGDPALAAPDLETEPREIEDQDAR